MYWRRNEVMVASSARAADFEDRTARLLAVAKGQPGFLYGNLWNSLGYPAKYSFGTAWEDRAAGMAYVKSEEYRAFQAANPNTGLSTQIHPVEAYEMVHAVQASDAAPGVYRRTVDWTLNPGAENAAAFEASRKELFELHRQHQPGFVINRLFRFLGSPNRYMIIQLNASLEGLRSAGASQALQEYARSHPDSLYASTPIVVDIYERVLLVQP